MTIEFFFNLKKIYFIFLGGLFLAQIKNQFHIVREKGSTSTNPEACG